MALLNFKYGKHGNLPEWSVNSVGTVFVTTDEQAMHIDLPDGRVVISQVINVANVTEWQNMKPPYSTQAFYYIVDANALLKYTGNGTTHSWKQINSTADVQAAIDKLRIDLGEKNANGEWISGLGLEVTGHSTDITNIKADIKDLKDADTEFSGNLENIANYVNDVEDLVHNLEDIVGYAGMFDTQEDALAGTNANEICLVNGVIKLCSVDDAGAKSLIDYNTVVAEIESLKKTVKELSDNTASDTTVADLQARVKALEDWEKELEEEIGEPASADGNTPATGMYALIAAAHTQANSAQDTADQALSDAQKANNAIGVPSDLGVTATGLYAKIEKNTSDIVTNAGDIAINAGDIDALESRADTLESRADTLESRADTLESRADTLESTVGDADSGLVKKTNDNATAINLNTTAIVEEIARAKNAEELNAKAITELRDEVMEDMQTADAMVFKDVVASATELAAKEPSAQVGHTYKASAEFEIDGIKVYIGDLLIATGEEDPSTGIINDVAWKHVPSGYIADYNPKIEAVEDIADDNEVILVLSSGVAKDATDLAKRGDLGKITLATDRNSSLSVSTDNAGKITFGMVWGTF